MCLSTQQAGEKDATSRPSYFILGHIAKDIGPWGTRIGGSFSYSAITARGLGERVGGVTSVGPDLKLEDTFGGIEVVCVPSPVTTIFENLYVGRRRKQFIRAVASPIEPQHIPRNWLTSNIVHLAPIAHELSTAIAQLFPQSFVGVTPQGWIRQWDVDGNVSKRAWSGAEDVLRSADAVVFSGEDVAGGEKAVASYARLTEVLVVTRGAEGADLHYRGRVHHFPAFPVREVDPTGAGDAFAAAFFVELHRSGDPFRATRFANCVASFVVEGVGLSGIPTREQVDERLRG